MKKILTALFLSYSIFAISQVTTQTQTNNWRVGGGIGLGMGSNDSFNFNISPFIGYEITPQVEAGISAGYQYSKWKYSKTNLFNIGPYLNAYPFQGLFLRAHYEYYTGNIKNRVDSNYSENFEENALWLGGGYRSTGKVQFYTGLMYNVLYKEDDSKIFSNGLRPIAGISVAL